MREMKDSGIEWVGEIPTGWSISPLKYDYSIVAGATPEGSNPEYWNGNVVWITPADYKTADVYVSGGYRTLSKKGYNSCGTTIIPAGNIIFSKRAPIGTVAINTIPLCTNQGCLGLVSRTKSENNKYFYYVLSIYPEVFNLFGSGTTFKEISANVFKNIPLPRPTSREQKMIADFLDVKCAEIDVLSSDIQAQIDTLEQYRRSVIFEAVTKGLDPNVPMKDSGIEWVGEIPENWEIGRISGYYSLRNTKVSDQDYTPLSVTNKGIVPQLDTVAKTNAHDARKLVKTGDFVINSRSDRRGACGISAYNGSVSLINTVLSPRGKMNPEFFDWMFHTIQFADEFYKWGHGIVDDLWTTNWQDMKKISIPVPSLQEQDMIASFLNAKCSEIDQVIAQKQEQLTTLADYKKSLIYEYVTGKKEVPAS